MSERLVDMLNAYRTVIHTLPITIEGSDKNATDAERDRPPIRLPPLAAGGNVRKAAPTNSGIALTTGISLNALISFGGKRVARAGRSEEHARTSPDTISFQQPLSPRSLLTDVSPTAGGTGETEVVPGTRTVG
jgi:hypothetical protein